ncbi:hypothetical protein QBC42DRAFT_347348 [Cladorrhinum samala]|uniref:Uncharacterized protein n=1 Tax=Cladorrhinum samala TaxID=585594 RepID=A0AAV9HLI3_9PEZI|nr:hypothetical protein QBC42DRAFT_347348 [Cladorrhinum samala]
MSVSYNPIAAACTLSPCLQQVAGYVDQQPAAQLLSCQSVFGFPVIPTLTLPGETEVFSTRISTYTDVVVVVTTSTVYSTAEETSTAYDTEYSTATEYTTTVINTITTAVSADAAPSITAAPALPKRQKLARRGGCKPRTTSTGLSLVPSNCVNLAEYSAACACLEPSTVRVPEPATTVITIDETVTVPAASTQEMVVTVGVTTVVVKPATTTIGTTLLTETIATTILTETIPTIIATSTTISTAPSAAPHLNPKTIVFTAMIAPENEDSLYISSLPQETSINAYRLVVLSGGGGFVLELPANSDVLRAYGADFVLYTGPSQTGQALVILARPADVDASTGVESTWQRASCFITGTGEDARLKCSSEAGRLNTFLRCNAGDNALYLAAPATPPTAGCQVVELGVNDLGL